MISSVSHPHHVFLIFFVRCLVTFIVAARRSTWGTGSCCLSPTSRSVLQSPWRYGAWPVSSSVPPQTSGSEPCILSLKSLTEISYPFDRMPIFLTKLRHLGRLFIKGFPQERSSSGLWRKGRHLSHFANIQSSSSKCLVTVYVVIFAVVLFLRISRVSHRKNVHFNIWLFIVMKTSQKSRN